MAKYTQEFKLEVVKYYLSGFGQNSTANKFNIHRSYVDKWVHSYQRHGLDGLKVQTSKSIYSIEFKLQAVQMILDGQSIQETSKQFDIKSNSQLVVWLRQYNEQGIEGLKPKPKGRAKRMPKPKSLKIKPNQADSDKTHNELLEELAYLRAENAFLKKLEALSLEQEAKAAAEQQRLQALYQD